MTTDLYYEVYDFYKKLYAEERILFHVNSNYVAICDDSHIVADVLKIPIDKSERIDLCRFSDVLLEDAISKLVQASVPIRIIEYRGISGQFEFPKVKQILQDMADDY